MFTLILKMKTFPIDVVFQYIDLEESLFFQIRIGSSFLSTPVTGRRFSFYRMKETR